MTPPALPIDRRSLSGPLDLVLDVASRRHSSWMHRRRTPASAPPRPRARLLMPPLPASAHSAVSPRPRRPWYRQLYVHVLLAIVAGVLLGWLAPDTGKAMEPIGTTFIAAMKMLIGPVVFLTIVAGIVGVADLKKVGVTGLKALGYFQIGTLFAMAFGLVAINLFR